MVTLFTTIYEKDFRTVLNENSWFFNLNNTLISKKIIIINNITSVDEFITLKSKFSKVFDFYESKDFIDEINKKYNINISNSDLSYYYSVQHYIPSLIEDKNEFYFYVGPDCTINDIENIENFIIESIDVINNNDICISTTLPWHEEFNSLKIGEHEENFFGVTNKNDKFYLSKVFSDQVYFTKKNKIMNCDFTNTDELHPFPFYGKNSFEYRLTNYFILTNHYRFIYKTNNYYLHKSF